MRGKLADGVLAVGGGVADVAAGWFFDLRERGLEGGDDDAGVVGAQCGLREVDEFARIVNAQVGDVVGAFDNLRDVGCFAGGADDFLVVLVTDEENLVALARIANGLGVDFGDEGAGGVDGGEFAISGLLADGG